MTIQKVTIAGAGTLGSQIAYQSALCGYQVKIWNPHPERAEKRIAALRPLYKHDLKLTDEQFDAGLKNIESITNDWQTAFNDADLVIEAVPENLDMKKDFYAQLCQVLPKDAIIAHQDAVQAHQDALVQQKQDEQKIKLLTDISEQQKELLKVQKSIAKDAHSNRTENSKQ